MATTEITRANFDETVKEGTVIIDWWAPWCGPCRAFAPIFESVAKQHPDVVFGKINTEDQPQLAGEFGIRSIPTLMVIRDGVLLLAQPGMLPKAALEDVVSQVQALDMDEVRQKIEQERKGKAAPATASA